MIPTSFKQLREDYADRCAYRRAWTLCLTPADAAAFSDALKAAFPAIRFVSVDYWQPWVDQERFNADWREFDRRWKLKLPREPVRRHMRDPTGEPLHYWESFADPAEWRFIAWIEPPGWRPVWMAPDEEGIRYIENTPRLWFEFQSSKFIVQRPTLPRWHDTEPQPLNGRETVALEGPTFEVRWNPSEPEAEAFAKKVYNILRRLTVSRFIVVIRESRRAYSGKAEGMLRQCLAGRHAVAWALKRRHNYLQCNNWGGVFLKPATYPFRRRDIYTPGEYKQHLADREAEFQAMLQAHLEESKRRARERAKSGEPPTLDLLVDGGGGLSGLKMRIPIGTITPRKKR